MSYRMKLRIKPIGFVQTAATGNEIRDKYLISRIIFRQELTEALDGIQDFSHLFVIFWLHRIIEKERNIMKVHPQGRHDITLLGVFATRTPCRPNPLGLTRVKLLGVDGNVATVQGLDAFDGTPVLDVKPFDFWDTTEDVRVPEWWMKLERERLERKKGAR